MTETGKQIQEDIRKTHFLFPFTVFLIKYIDKAVFYPDSSRYWINFIASATRVGTKLILETLIRSAQEYLLYVSSGSICVYVKVNQIHNWIEVTLIGNYLSCL